LNETIIGGRNKNKRNAMHRNEIKGTSNLKKRNKTYMEINESVVGERKKNNRIVIHKNEIKRMSN
jgi:hypothetical protein